MPGKLETSHTAATDTGPFAVVPVAVLNDPNVDDRALRFYIALASYADKGGEAWPSQETLAERLRCSVPTVKRALKDLIGSGWVRVDKRRDAFGKVAGNRYSVLRVSPEITSDPWIQGSKLPLSQGSNSAIQGSPGDPSIDELTNLEQTTRTDQNNVERVFEAWKLSTEHPRAQLDDKRRAYIKEALKAYPVEYVIDAVRGWKHVPFNRGENDRRTVYNELHILLRDSNQIEKFAEATRDPAAVVNHEGDLIHRRPLPDHPEKIGLLSGWDEWT